MRWGVNISLLMAMLMMLGVMEGVTAFVHALNCESGRNLLAAFADLWLLLFLTIVSVAGALAAICNGVAFFRQRRGAPMSWALHLWNGSSFSSICRQRSSICGCSVPVLRDR